MWIKKLGGLVGAVALAGATVAALQGTADATSEPPASLLATCYSYTNGTATIAYGTCSNVASGQRWRLGVICDSGYYYWSPWQTVSLTKSYDCPGVPGKVTSHWVDVE